MGNLFLFVLTIVSFLSPEVSTELPEYNVMKTTEKIVIDGILDENDWISANSCGDFVFPWDEVKGEEQTEVKMLWDDKFLYLSYKCYDKNIWATHYDTNADTYLDDCVEFFWNPNPEKGKVYNMFEINALGNLLSVYKGSGESIHNRISRIMPPHIAQTIDGTVNNGDDIDTSWTLEIAVRFSDYPELSKREVPLDGDMWRVGLNRCGGRNGQTAEHWSVWSPSDSEKPLFHAPDSFGKIFFRNKPVH